MLTEDTAAVTAASDDDMDAVYAAAFADDDATAPTAEGDATAPAAEGDAAAPAAEDDATAPTAEGTAPAAKPTTSATAGMSDEQFAALLEAARGGAQGAPKAEEPAPADEPEVTVESFMSDDDKKYLKAYDDEWTEVSKAESIRREAAIKYAQHQVYNEVAKALAPVTKLVRELSVDAHFGKIRAAHSDFDTVVPKAQAWVSQQPAVIKQGLEQVLTHGSAAQVIELLSAYKQSVKATGAVPASPAPSTQQPPAPARPVRRVADAAAALAPSGAGQRTRTSAGADPNDFAAALAEALNA